MSMSLNSTLFKWLNYFKHAYMFKIAQLYKMGTYRRLNITDNLKCS